MDRLGLPYTENAYCLYILANRQRNKLKILLTADWAGKLRELEYTLFHQHPDPQDYTVLLYWETHHDAIEAMHREQQLNAWSYRKKAGLIDRNNPSWLSLIETDN